MSCIVYFIFVLNIMMKLYRKFLIKFILNFSKIQEDLRTEIKEIRSEFPSFAPALAIIQVTFVSYIRNLYNYIYNEILFHSFLTFSTLFLIEIFYWYQNLKLNNDCKNSLYTVLCALLVRIINEIMKMKPVITLLWK